MTRRPINSAAEPHGRTAAGSLDQNDSVATNGPEIGARATASAPDSTSQVSNCLAVPAELPAGSNSPTSALARFQPVAVKASGFRKNQLDKLVAAAKNGEGASLIAWQHEDIPAIAALILGSASGVPPKWPGGRFDLVWVFDRQDGGTWSFTQAPQLLLPGDSSAPIGLSG